MIAELQPVWKQFDETYSAIREALAAAPEDRLAWSPSTQTRSIAEQVQHIARGNVVYCCVMERTEVVRIDVSGLVTHADLEGLLELSEAHVRETFENLSGEDARAVCADDWSPLGPNVPGPLDALWFAHQIVRHSAYHLGQLNYVAQLGGFALDYE